MSAIPSWAVKGRKVACVDAGPLRFGARSIPSGLSNKATYTIRKVVIESGLVGVHLMEVTNPFTWPITGDEASYRIDRFRPLVTLEHDMAVHFSALLDVPASHEVDA